MKQVDLSLNISIEIPDHVNPDTLEARIENGNVYVGTWIDGYFRVVATLGASEIGGVYQVDEVTTEVFCVLDEEGEEV